MKIEGPNPAIAGLDIIGEEIRKSLDSAPKNATFRVTVGYISESGTAQLEGSLKRVIAQNGTVEVIVGLNEVSKRSVKALATLYNVCGGIGVFVFWNPSINVTFHPKCYLLKTPRSGRVYAWIGSSNFTKQGMFSNYECNLSLVLEPNKDQKLIAQIEDYYSKLRNSPDCHALDLATLGQLRSLKGIPNGEKPIVDSPKIHDQVKAIFGLKPPVTLPKKAFVMTLSKNDIDGKRGEPYFLVPIAAMQLNHGFWGWPLTTSPASKFPSSAIQAKIKVGNMTTTENRRIYYVGGRQELRFVSPTIYKLGLSFLGSVLTIRRKGNVYQLEVVDRQDQRYAGLLKSATHIASSQKLWGYT